MVKEELRIFLAGDSTVADYPEAAFPQMGWGQALGRFFEYGVVIRNYAVNGRSSKSFINEGRLKTIFSELRKDDYLFIQFGHNDEKEDNERHTDAFTTYKYFISFYVEGAKALSAKPVLITPINRRSFDKDGKIIDTHRDYTAAMRGLAVELNVPIIDLNYKSKLLFEALGEEKTKEIFLWLKPDKYENFKKGLEDNTHFSDRGAEKIAELVVEGIKEIELQPLKNRLKSF
jgi:lysophospholipase L1-like esterase